MRRRDEAALLRRFLRGASVSELIEFNCRGRWRKRPMRWPEVEAALRRAMLRADRRKR